MAPIKTNTRRGHILVEQTDDLFSTETIKKICENIDLLCKYAEENLGISSNRATIRFRQHSISSSTPSKTLSSLYKLQTESAQYVRIIISSQTISHETIKLLQSGNMLLVIIELKNATPIISNAKNLQNVCKITVPSHNSARILEDIAFEISIAQHFRQLPIIKSIIEIEGLSSLYRKKVKYFSLRKQTGWLSNINKKSKYAPFSVMSKANQDDIKTRAEDNFQFWSDFIDNLKNLPNLINNSPEYTANNISDFEITRAFRQLPKLGGQLSTKKLCAHIHSLPKGSYWLIVLRKAGKARRSPRANDVVEALFGPTPPNNSYKFLDKDEYNSYFKNLGSLFYSGIYVAYHVTIGTSNVRISEMVLKSGR
jgi:hypothetical protein